MSHDPRLVASTADLPKGAVDSLRRSLWLLMAVITVSLAVATGSLLHSMWEEMRADAGRRASDTARLLEEHVIRVLHATDFLVGQAAEVPMDGNIAGRRLRALETGLPEPGALLLLDPSGRLVASSRQPASPAADFSGMGFFVAHRNGAAMLLGPLTRLPGGGGSVFTVSRRLSGPKGDFRGVVVATIDAQYFTTFYRALPLGEHANTGLYDNQGRIVLRQPHPELWEGRDIADGPLMRAAATSPQGVLEATSPLDGTRRIVAYRVLPDGVGLVSCGVAADDLFAAWKLRAAGIGGGTGLVLLMLFGISTIAFRSLRREQATLSGLEAAVRERTAEASHQADEARRANESKTRFLAAASHDLRQPLQAAGMFAEVLSARLADSPHQPVVEKLRQSIDATGTLLNTLLDVSTLEAGKVVPHVTTFPLMPLLAGLADQMEPDAAERSLRLRVAPTSAWVRSDPVLLERVLRNITVNALRYTARGGVVLGCRHRPDGRLAIQVVDSGIGIPADRVDMIFEDFTRLDTPGLRQNRRGLGLGLGVVRRTTLLLGHDVEVRSQVGKGTVFSVIVPETTSSAWAGDTR